jgi:hypothetical protein
MLLIYCNHITSRCKYAFKLVFRDLLRLPYEITTNKEDFLAFEGPKFSYTKQRIENTFWFYSSGLLFEKGIKLQEIRTFEWQHTKAFFRAPINADFSFDPFAASFYLTSRYEEYLPHLKDKHGRFVAEQSLAYEEKFLDKPVVDYYALAVYQFLKEKFDDFPTYKRTYAYQPTIDIDNAFAIKNKGFERIIAGLFQSLFKADFKAFKERLYVALHLQQDPYDTYDYQLQLIKKHNLNIIYFILLGDYAQYDKNVPSQNKNLQSLIKFLSDYGQIGIHPSYASNKNYKKLFKEINRLSNILHSEIKMSRQHFLKFTLPETYQKLIEADITDDYTMGYSSQIGFRASTCSPFFFYDLDLETETPLKLHPFAVMDGTLKDYLNLPPSKVFKIVKPIIDEIKKVSGTFITVWHNESFADTPRWNGWKKVYEEITEEALRTNEDSIL